jgi:hypothetical protein
VSGSDLHRSRIAFGVFFCSTFALLSATSAPAGTPKGYYVTSFVDPNSFAHILRDTLYTHNGASKSRTGAQHNLCRDSILAQFQADGLTAALWPFSYLGYTQHNVVAQKTGTVRPNDIYIIGAHYDSVGNPGADDDASGVAAMLEMARIISQWPSDATIRFVAFDMEETGLYGSTAYAQFMHNQGLNLVGMVQMEMLAYRGSTGTRSYVYGRPVSNSVKTPLRQALIDYGGLNAIDGGVEDGSDHHPFETQGYPAAVTSEYDWQNNPNYHMTTDSVDQPGYIDYAYAASVTKGGLGWLVDTAGVNPPHPLADTNCDYAVTFADIDPFVVALGGESAFNAQYPGCNWLSADTNGDGNVTFADIDGFVALLSQTTQEP